MANWAPAGTVLSGSTTAGAAASATNTPPPTGYMAPTNYLKPHRGTAVLVLGILSLVVCWICGIIAWVMGNNDLREMAAGTMDRSGEGNTKAGRICGIIGTCLAIVGFIIGILWFIGMVVFASHSSHSIHYYGP